MGAMFRIASPVGSRQWGGVTADKRKIEGVAFFALLVGNLALAAGPFLVRNSGVGPVSGRFLAAGAGAAFPVAARPLVRPAGASPAQGADDRYRSRRLLLRRRSRRLARGHPADQARQRHLVRQYLQLLLRRLGAVACPQIAVTGAGAGADARRRRLRDADVGQRGAVRRASSRRPARRPRRAALHFLSDHRRTHPRRAAADAPAVPRQHVRCGHAAPGRAGRRGDSYPRPTGPACLRWHCAVRSLARACWSMRSAMSRRWSSASPC